MKNIIEDISLIEFVVNYVNALYFSSVDTSVNDEYPNVDINVNELKKLAVKYEHDKKDSYVSITENDMNNIYDLTQGHIIRDVLDKANILIFKMKDINFYKPWVNVELTCWFKKNMNRK